MQAPRAQISAFTSSGQQQENSEIYEMRTYDVKPGKLDDYIKTCIAGVHLRTVHSEMIGFWTVVVGGLNKVFHLWKYDSFEHRKRVNAALQQDKAWQDVVSTLVTFLDKLDVEIAYIMPWSQLGKTTEKGGKEGPITELTITGVPILCTPGITVFTLGLTTFCHITLRVVSANT